MTDETKMTRRNIFIEDELHAEIEKWAKKKGLKTAQGLRLLLRQALQAEAAAKKSWVSAFEQLARNSGKTPDRLLKIIVDGFADTDEPEQPAPPQTEPPAPDKPKKRGMKLTSWLP